MLHRCFAQALFLHLPVNRWAPRGSQTPGRGHLDPEPAKSSLCFYA